MKLTESRLKQMIREVLNEADQPPFGRPVPPVIDPGFTQPSKSDMDILKRLDKIEMMLKAIIKFHRITDNVPSP